MQKILRVISPEASPRIQTYGAAIMWAIGAAILLSRGLAYVHDRHWHAWALALGITLGVLKARLLLTRVAQKAVIRINERGRAHFFGFFSLRSWALVATMMGGGIALRHLVVNPTTVGAGIMGALYIGVGTALAIADRTFWLAALHGSKEVHDADQGGR